MIWYEPVSRRLASTQQTNLEFKAPTCTFTNTRNRSAEMALIMITGDLKQAASVGVTGTESLIKLLILFENSSQSYMQVIPSSAHTSNQSGSDKLKPQAATTRHQNIQGN